MIGKLKTQIDLQDGTIKAKKAEVLDINLIVRGWPKWKKIQ